MSTVSFGRDGEKKVQRWLKEQKSFNILFTNFRKKGFEIDIIALDSKNILRFIEVKTVDLGSIFDASYSIEKRNMLNYQKGALSFIQQYPEYSEHQLSMDAVVLEGNKFHYYENISGLTLFS